MGNNTMVQLFRSGGGLMWPLLLCSILTIAVIMDRIIFFLRIAKNYKSFVARLLPLVANQRIQATKDYLRGRQDPASLVSAAYLANLDVSAKLRKEVVQRVGNEQVERIEKRHGILSAIAHLAPLLGLFGTVLGMIEAFRRVQELKGQADVADIAGGIWEALLTTAFGLAIAIPAAAAYHYFEALAARHRNRMSNIVSVLDEALGLETGTDEIASPGTPGGDEDYAGI